MNLKKAIRSPKQQLEQLILERVLYVSMGVIVMYVVYDFFINGSTLGLLNSAIIFLMYAFLLILLSYHKHFELVKTWIFIFFVLSIIAAFFSFDGLNDVAILDISNLVPAIFIMFEGRKLKIFMGLYLSIVLVLIYIHLYHHELVINVRPHDTAWFDVFEKLTRLATWFNLVFAFKIEYEKDYFKIRMLNEELFNKNIEISQKKEELKKQTDKIYQINKELEQTLNHQNAKIQALDRKVIEYTFINAHSLRAPIARILGVVGLAKLINSKKEELDIHHFLELISHNAQELDVVIRKINQMLEEREDLLNH